MWLGLLKSAWMLLLLAAMACCQLAFANEDLRNDFQNWDLVTITLPVTPGKKVQWYAEAQPRVGNLQDRGTSGDFSQLILRTALGYRLTEKISVWQGYGWTPIFEPQNLNEHRIYQQLSVNGKWKRLLVNNRSRLEQRWIENTGGETSIRLRHMARGMYPLDQREQWFLVAYDEFFITLKGVPNGPATGFDQNRLFVGLHRKLKGGVNAEAGYLNQYINTQDPVPNRMNHVLILTLNFELK
ncbi:DUF2490 domain-containing protein [Vampirovibrio sp.]|uniref:DUF2490 domain-containing protein n=1 Tax=Vampirovibrio sp. TaxID=2717857 RepID=UPI0035944567